jgi:hypothetical protein
MWELSKKQAKEFEIKYLEEFFEKEGFKLRKGSSADFDFIRKTQNGNEVVYFTHLESFPGTQQEFYILKEISEIELHYENILKGLGQVISKHKNPRSLKFWKGSIEGINSNRYMPEMLNEADVSASCEIVKDFMLKIGFPMLERFNDIKELDREINGENFWTTDWQMPFNLGGDFPIKRIMIAKMANNSKLEKIILSHLEQYEKDISSGEYVDIHKESLKQFKYAVEYLKQIQI